MGINLDVPNLLSSQELLLPLVYNLKYSILIRDDFRNSTFFPGNLSSITNSENPKGSHLFFFFSFNFFLFSIALVQMLAHPL